MDYTLVTESKAQSSFYLYLLKKKKKQKKSVGNISVILAVQLILVVINSVNQKHYVLMMTVYRHVNILLLKTRLVSPLYIAHYMRLYVSLCHCHPLPKTLRLCLQGTGPALS
jgi:hypothetical protein